MFSRSKNTNLQKPKKLHSLEYFKYLYSLLQKNYAQSDCNAEQVVESLRLFSEILVWGDQNDGAIMDYFLEQNALDLLIEFLTKGKDANISVQLLQTFNILFENLSNKRALYYLLSQNHVNKIILQDFDFENEEVIGYYIALLKSLSFRVDEDTINFFYDEAEKRFPLYLCALRFFNHSESMVRAAVRTITLNIFKIRHVPSSFFVYAYTAVPYFSQLTDEMRRTALAINDCICLVYNHQNYGRLEGLVAEQIDHLHYLDDIFSLGIPDLTDVLFLILLQRLLLPLYVYSLTKRHPPATVSDAPEGRSYFFHAVALFLLSQVFTILHQPELIRVLTEAILVGDLALLCPPAPDSTDSTENVVLQLRAAHHGRNAAKTSPAGSRLVNFVRTAAECDSFIRCVIVTTGLEAGIAKATEAICNYSNVASAQGKSPKTRAKQPTPSARVDGAQSNSGKGDQPLTANGTANTTGAENASVPAVHDQEEVEAEEAPASPQSTTPASSFVLTGKPFLRAIFRSLEVGPGTDYDTLYALNLLIALKMNGCQDESTLRLAEIGTPSPESPCNPMLLTNLLDIIIDASKPGSRVRVVTLNLALFLLFLLTRDASNVCQLSEDQRTQLNSAFVRSRSVLQDFYINEVDFLDIFEHEVSRYRRLKLHPSTLLENPALLLCHAADAIKLSSNRSQENVAAAAAAAAAGGVGGPPTAFRSALSLSPDAALYYVLPSSELEHIQRAVAVFLCLYGYAFIYAPLALESGDAGAGGSLKPERSAAASPRHCVLPPDLADIPSVCLLGNLPLLAKSTVSVGDSINTAQHQIFSCEIEHQNGLKEKRYLIVTDSQLLLVEPSPKPIGWGSVTFAGLLQDTEIKLVSSDSRCLSAVVYRPGDRAAALLTRNDPNDIQALRNPGLKSPHLLHPLMTAKLRFQTSMPCSTICNLITMRCERIRSAKVVQLSRLLRVSEKSRSSANLQPRGSDATGGAPFSVSRKRTTDRLSPTAAGPCRVASTPSLTAPFSPAPSTTSTVDSGIAASPPPSAAAPAVTLLQKSNLANHRVNPSTTSPASTPSSPQSAKVVEKGSDALTAATEDVQKASEKTLPSDDSQEVDQSSSDTLSSPLDGRFLDANGAPNLQTAVDNS